MIQAIETHYAGCRFRSRLEARWAVFFDALDVEWEYEPQGFELPSGRYLPDFWLPRRVSFFEVKGQAPTRDEVHLCVELASHTSSMVALAYGAIPRPDRECDRLILVSPGAGISRDFEWNMSREIRAALTAARSARFEHGENGAPMTWPLTDSRR